MTRAELERLRTVEHCLDVPRTMFDVPIALVLLRDLIEDAEREHAIEDAWHDRPINMEDSTHGTH